MYDEDRVAAPGGLALADVRAGLAEVIESCRVQAWESLHAEDGPRQIPVEWLSDLVGQLQELDHGLAVLDRQAGVDRRVVTPI